MHFAFRQLQLYSFHPPECFDSQNLSVKLAILHPLIVASQIATHYKAGIPIFIDPDPFPEHAGGNAQVACATDLSTGSRSKGDLLGGSPFATRDLCRLATVEAIMGNKVAPGCLIV